MAKKRKSNVRKRRQGARKLTQSRSRKAADAKKTRTPRYVYYFGDGHADGRGTMKALLGGKGANLHEMTRIGLPVPPGFTITTEVCSYFYGFAVIFTITIVRIRRSWRRKSRRLWPRSKNPPAKGSATSSGLCWCPCALALAIPCRE